MNSEKAQFHSIRRVKGPGFSKLSKLFCVFAVKLSETLG